jgi:deoxyuridine 5'-triphosphate nucleotidohydrolase
MAKPCGVTVVVKRLSHGEGLPLPRIMTPGSVGMDVAAALAEEATIPPGGRLLVPTGFAVAVPEGYEMQVRPRSGLALRHGLTLLNTPGTIDPDYREELRIILVNLGSEPVVIRRGDRIAQLVVAPAVRPVLVEADELPMAPGRSGGFGHTGR